MKKSYLFALVLFTLLILPRFAIGQNARSAFLDDIRTLGMGGAGIATATGSFSYIYNPALLVKEKFSLTLPGIQFAFGDNFFEIIDYAVENEENFLMLDEESSATQAEKDSLLNFLRIEAAQLDNIWYKTSITPYFGMVVKNIGISMYNVTNLATKVDVGIIVPKLKIYAYDDLVLSLGYGFQYNEKLALGFGAKFIRRFESPVFKVQIEEAAGFEETFEEGFEEMKEGETGFAADVGALYQFNEKLMFAAVAQDLLGKVGANTIPLNFKLGMMYQLNNKLQLAADIEDFFNNDGDKFVNKIYFGAEYRLPIISFRFGFGQGYPAVGLGLNLWIMDLAYTLYSTEVTDTPGLQGETYHMIGLRLGWQ